MKLWRLALALSLVVSLSGCKSIANIIAPPAEDISAVQAAVEKQKEASELALSLHKKSMQQLHDMGIDEAYGRIRQATLDEIHKASSETNSITPEKLATINAQADAERVVSKKAWDDALVAGFEPQAWADLKLASDALNLFILTRMGVEDQKNALMLQAHDLIKKK